MKAIRWKGSLHIKSGPSFMVVITLHIIADWTAKLVNQNQHHDHYFELNNKE